MVEKLKSEHEYEVSLVVDAACAESIFQQVAALQMLGEHRLVEKSTIFFSDDYFDTPDLFLFEAGFGLRIRTVDRQQLVTLKGKTRKTKWSGSERLELEFPWSFAGWSRIKEVLVHELPELSIEEEFNEAIEAEIFFKQLGFDKIQRRKNKRQLRLILPTNSAQVLAELALDSLTLVFPQKEFYMYEIEIEARSELAIPAIQKMISDLLARFDQSIRIWEHSKLATGVAIQALMNQKQINTAIDRKDRLTLKTYQLLDDYFKNRSVRRKDSPE